MSFSFIATGSPAAVSATMDKRSELESNRGIVVKETIKHLLSGAPAGTIVTVEANGYHYFRHDRPGSYASVDLRFRVHTPEPEPVPSVDEPTASE